MTTAPKHYLVNPNQGLIDADTMIEVNIQVKLGPLMPQQVHKFLIKTLPVEDSIVDASFVWDQTDSGLTQDTKLNVIYSTQVAFANRGSFYKEPEIQELPNRAFDNTVSDLEKQYHSLMKLSKYQEKEIDELTQRRDILAEKDKAAADMLKKLEILGERTDKGYSAVWLVLAVLIGGYLAVIIQ